MQPPKHQSTSKPTEQERKARLDARRGSSTQRGYDSDWRKVRLRHLSLEPLCRFHAQLGQIVVATVVDHIITIKQAPELRLDYSNLRSLCKPCHDAHTAREQGFAKR